MHSTSVGNERGQLAVSLAASQAAETSRISWQPRPGLAVYDGRKFVGGQVVLEQRRSLAAVHTCRWVEDAVQLIGSLRDALTPFVLIDRAGEDDVP
jgi:hypothetical protein